MITMSQNSGRAVLVRDGKPVATIVLGADPSESEVRAAGELQTYLAKIAGSDGSEDGKCAIRSESQAPHGTRIYVGRTARADQSDVDFTGLADHSFTLQTMDDGLVLCGKDDLGTEYAVYTFLETYCGVRWLWPGELGQHVPHKDTLEVVNLCDTQQPAFALTRFGKDPQWRRRNKLLREMQFHGGHEWGRLLAPSEYGPKHPEYFALVDGTREKDWDAYDGQHGYQLCTSNPDLIRLCIEKIREFLDEHPDVGLFCFGANDGYGFCECDRCQALGVGRADDDEAGKRATRRLLSDRIYEFTNLIAAEIAKTHPDRYVAQFAYGPYADPPVEVRPLDNVVPWITLNCEANHDPQHKQKHWDRLAQWADLSRRLYIYEYFNHTWKLELPRAMPKTIAEAIPYYRKCGATWFSAQTSNDFFTEGLNYYLVAKLLWDTTVDVEALVDDYCRSAFGGAAETMRTYYRRLEQHWADSVREFDTGEHYAGTPDQYLLMLTPETMAELKGYLNEALGMAEEGEYRRRVEFMREGWRFVELEVKAFRLLRELADKEIVLNYHPAGWKSKEIADLSALSMPKEEARPLILATIAAWEARSRFVEEHKDDFIIDYGHTTAWNCTDDRFHPVAALKQAMAAAGWDGEDRS